MMEVSAYGDLEREVLLEHGLSYQIVEAELRADGKLDVTARIVPGGGNDEQ